MIPDSEATVLARIKRIGHLIDRFMIGVKSDIDRKYAEAKAISPIQGRIILYLHAMEKADVVFQKDIETFFDIRSSTAAIILGRMEKNNLVARETSAADERKKTVRLTHKAKKLHPKVHAEIVRAEAQVVQGISKRDMAAFFRVLDKMADNLS